MNDFKKIVTAGITVTAALIGTYYIQFFLESTFSNVIFRWSLGWSICLFMAYHATESIIRYLNKNNPSEEWVQSYSVFRIHTNDSSIDGWLVSENELIKKNVLLDMIGYIPLDSKLGKPEYIFSHAVIRIEFLFVREQPKYFHQKQVVLPESPPSTFDELREFELKNKLSKESENHSFLIAPSSRSSHFNPLNELVMHTARSFWKESRVIDFSDDYLVNAMTLRSRLGESSSDVIIMETFYFKVIGTKLLDIQIHQKQQDIAEYILDSNGDKALDISQDDESVEKHRAERNKERKILEDTVNILKSLVKSSN